MSGPLQTLIYPLLYVNAMVTGNISRQLPFLTFSVYYFTLIVQTLVCHRILTFYTMVFEMMSTPDIAVLVAYFVAVLLLGLWVGRHERDTQDYFLGGRRQHWLLVGLSILATEVSALTFIGVPGESFHGDWTYLQMYFGSFLGRMLIVYLLLPAFYGGRVTTVYEYLGQRFGPCTRTMAAILFCGSRIIGSGIRLLAASLAIAVVFDWPLYVVIVGAAGVAIAYTVFGGIKAIIWTDALQALVFLGGAVAVILFLFLHTPGSLSENIEAARSAGKLHIFTFDWSPNNVQSFWVLTLHATLMNMAALGTDQDLTQRMLTCPDLARGQRSLILNAFLGFPMVCLFLLIGSLMFVYYQTAPQPELFESGASNSDKIFPYFIATTLPPGLGLRGLLIAGIFASAMSSVDSALGALSSTVVTDFYRPFIRKKASEAHYLAASRWCTLFFGLLLVVVAIAFSTQNQLLWAAFKWVSLVFGGLLGIFLLGVTTRRRGNDAVNVPVMLSSIVVLVLLRAYQQWVEEVYIAWPWWIVLGTVWTYVMAWCMNSGSTPLLKSGTRSPLALHE